MHRPQAWYWPCCPARWPPGSYTLWYLALRGLTSTQAAVVQLSVPVIAALGGMLFVGEAITLRLMLATLLILGSILLVILGRDYVAQRNPRQDDKMPG